jgi:integrase/recombinase XerD
MRKHHPDNERIKREYFVLLKEAKGQSEDSVDAVAKAIARFEADTQHPRVRHQTL